MFEETIRLVNVNIPDYEIAKLARISHGGNFYEFSTEDDVQLLKRLWKMGHYTPFEFQQFIFYVKVPIYTQRQLMRHRTSSYIERSLRYVKLNKNKNYFYFEPEWDESVKEFYEEAYKKYTELLEKGYKAEEARVVLPLGLMTEFYWRIDARNLFNFLKLRLDNHAQKNIRVVANEIMEILKNNKNTKNLYEIYKEALKI